MAISVEIYEEIRRCREIYGYGQRQTARLLKISRNTVKALINTLLNISLIEPISNLPPTSTEENGPITAIPESLSAILSITFGSVR